MYLCMKLECLEIPQSPHFSLGQMDSFLALGGSRTRHSAVGKCTSGMEVYLENTENAKGHVASCHATCWYEVVLVKGSFASSSFGCLHCVLVFNFLDKNVFIFMSYLYSSFQCK